MLRQRTCNHRQGQQDTQAAYMCVCVCVERLFAAATDSFARLRLKLLLKFATLLFLDHTQLQELPAKATNMYVI